MTLFFLNSEHGKKYVTEDNALPCVDWPYLLFRRVTLKNSNGKASLSIRLSPKNRSSDWGKEPLISTTHRNGERVDNLLTKRRPEPTCSKTRETREREIKKNREELKKRREKSFLKGLLPWNLSSFPNSVGYRSN